MDRERELGVPAQLRCDAGLLARSNVDLVFDGLDAAAQVYLNGVQVLAADNMFRIWRVPVKGHLHAGKNLLRVVFPSPIKAAQEVAASDPFGSLKTKTAPRPISARPPMSTAGTGGRVCDQRHLASGAAGGLGQGAHRRLRHSPARREQGSGALDAEVEVEAASAGPPR
jgi:hypothetical protein